MTDSEQLLELVRRSDAARRAIESDDFETALQLLDQVLETPSGDGAAQVLRARALEANRQLTESLEAALDRTKKDLARVRRGRRFLEKLPSQETRAE